MSKTKSNKNPEIVALADNGGDIREKAIQLLNTLEDAVNIIDIPKKFSWWWVIMNIKTVFNLVKSFVDLIKGWKQAKDEEEQPGG